MLIVFEGVDSSGKQTQTELFYKYLVSNKKNAIKITFPNYSSPSSELVRMYLRGEFGDNAVDVSPFAASAFYAVDRYSSYKKDWKSHLDSGGIVVADRYTTSNLVHQAAKISDIRKKEDFLDWVADFEYVRLGLPKPDKVIFLDMPPEFTAELMAKRANKITGKEQKDIHEKDEGHIRAAYENALYVSKKFRWDRVRCTNSSLGTDDSLRTVEDIQEEIVKIIGI